MDHRSRGEPCSKEAEAASIGGSIEHPPHDYSLKRLIVLSTIDF